MGELSNQIKSFDGTELYLRQWDVVFPRAVICVVHGFGEHIGRYKEFAEFFNRHDFSVYGIDLRGHGHSSGLKGHVHAYSDLLSDIEEMMKIARVENLEIPIFLFGHSMGGNLVINFMMQKQMNEIAGFIASSPWLGLAFQPPKWKIMLGNFFAKWFPKFRQNNGLDASNLSRDLKIVEAYQTDPLVNRMISAGLFNAVTNAGNFALQNQEKIKVEGYVYHGDADRIIDHNVSKKFAKGNEKLLTWTSWEGTYHEPHNDLDKNIVLGSVLDWCQKRIKY
jgi:acylglycerol lipase